jgi:ribosomal protein L9
MVQAAYSKESNETSGQNEKVDLRKHKKRITTYEEKQFILETRKKYSDNDLRSKMAKISKKLKEEGKIYGSG